MSSAAFLCICVCAYVCAEHNLYMMNSVTDDVGMSSVSVNVCLYLTTNERESMYCYLWLQRVCIL